MRLPGRSFGFEPGRGYTIGAFILLPNADFDRPMQIFAKAAFLKGRGDQERIAALRNKQREDTFTGPPVDACEIDHRGAWGYVEAAKSGLASVISCWARAMRDWNSLAVMGWTRSPSGRRESKAGGSLVSGCRSRGGARARQMALGAITAASPPAGPLYKSSPRNSHESAMGEMMLVEVGDLDYVGGVAAAG